MKLTFVESPLGHDYRRVWCGLLTMAMGLCSSVLTWMMVPPLAAGPDCLGPVSTPDSGLSAAPDPV